jgi:arylsulfatase A-like enzyme
LDTARFDRFGCYGHDRDTTPFIDSLAADGTLYDQAYSNSIWSLPAYGSLFTGMYPSQHGAVDWGKRIERNSLIEGLSAAGYRTHAISPHVVSGEFNIEPAFSTAEWVRKPGTDLPFEDDPAVERVRQRTRSGSLSSPVEKGLALAKYTLTERSWQSIPNGVYHLYCLLARRRGWWSDDGASEVFDRARAFVDRTEGPFFLFTNFVEPHAPYRPPREYIRTFMPSDVSLAEMNDAIEVNFVEATAGITEITARQREILAALHDAELRYLDDQLRTFHDYLSDAGIAENTVIAVFSDHGDLWGEGGVWGHQARIHRQLCRVPLVVSYPWDTPTTHSDVVELADLHDHFLALADGSREGLSGDGAVVEYHGWDTQLSFKPWDEYEGVDESEYGQYQASIAKDGYRLYWDATGTVELYETTARTDTDVSEGNPEVTSELQSELKRRVGTPTENQRAYRREGGGSGLAGRDDDVQKRLADLGYI